MSLWLRSRRYANQTLKVGRLLVVFRGELAEIPGWAARERDWILARIPGIAAAEPPRPAAPPEPPPSTAPGDGPEVIEDEAPRKGRGPGRKRG